MAGPSNARESNVFNEDRLASIVRSVYTALQSDFTAAAQTSSPHASVEEEIRSRFETPRGATSGSSLHPYPPSQTVETVALMLKNVSSIAIYIE